MIDLIAAPPYVAAFRFSGKLTGEDYDRCIAEIEARLAEYPRIAILSDMTGMTGLSAEAVGKDLRYALDKFGEYSRFARAAVVTDKGWLGKVSEFSGKFLPKTEVRAFDPGQADAALAWAAELDPDAGD
ncbi:STAS/SEC14 domain-containing protein [Pseudoxanthomonas wuyuanensis]|uniref:SpoIIAA-like n=1 Tax=Pseudoxanthomonas wuyuanensis TaxID=1073196 RepID=A0A286D787_9GAMM|nr:STAS/SEC14 domain-containing protein [Pseudoxanthomonas wuyuanensis]SOD54516.1 SpoIIAA-like [Pseudoxanthomonas wuyuanensis]